MAKEIFVCFPRGAGPGTGARAREPGPAQKKQKNATCDGNEGLWVLIAMCDEIKAFRVLIAACDEKSYFEEGKITISSFLILFVMKIDFIRVLIYILDENEFFSTARPHARTRSEEKKRKEKNKKFPRTTNHAKFPSRSLSFAFTHSHLLQSISRLALKGTPTKLQLYCSTNRWLQKRYQNHEKINKYGTKMVPSICWTV